MATIGTVITQRLLNALNSPTVSSQTGLTNDVWSLATAPHVFRGFTGMLGGRNRGRLPFIEFEITTDGFHQTWVEGGDLTATITLRVHVGGRDQQVAGDLAEAITLASLAAIRSEQTDNYFALGDDNVSQLKVGPWGHMRESTLTVQLTYDRGAYDLKTYG